MTQYPGAVPDKDTAQADYSPKGPRRRLREMEESELRKILTAHKNWAAQSYEKWVKAETAEKEKYEQHRPDMALCDLRGRDLRNCDLRGANFSAPFGGRGDFNLECASDLEDARLTGASMQGAILRGVNLRKADLEDANLEGADLCYANLKDAVLCRVNLTRAALSHVTGLEGSSLQDVNLENATGLKGSEFARSQLTGAQLPHGIRDFAILHAVEDISKNAQTAFLSMLLGCLYSWLTIATTIDARLLTNSASSPLPLIQTQVPIAGFYWAAPLILTASFVWLHLYLQEMWRGLAGLPAIFPDGKPLDEKASPWLLTGLVRPHFKLLNEDRPPLSRIRVGISILLAWWLVPATLVLFWLRYLPRHDWRGTALHVAMLVVAIMCAVRFQHLAKLTLRGELRGRIWPSVNFSSAAEKTRLSRLLEFFRIGLKNALRRTWRLAASGLLVLLLTVVVSDGAINGTVPRRQNGQRLSHRVIVPKVLPYFGARAFADLEEAVVSTRPESWFLATRVEPLDVVNGAQLRGADLRYASAEGAFLAKADLRGAELQGANLRDAKLQQANFTEAHLVDTDLRDADLTEAMGITQEQLNHACVNEKTRIPEALALPKAQLECSTTRRGEGSEAGQVFLQGPVLARLCPTGLNRAFGLPQPSPNTPLK
jgi:uncharacterized protein YjbI with pentapeptide repeats